ncbi:hypothetical protein BPY_10760 [Bifidobacterium psychraerophilum]
MYIIMIIIIIECRIIILADVCPRPVRSDVSVRNKAGESCGEEGYTAANLDRRRAQAFGCIFNGPNDLLRFAGTW